MVRPTRDASGPITGVFEITFTNKGDFADKNLRLIGVTNHLTVPTGSTEMETSTLVDGTPVTFQQVSITASAGTFKLSLARPDGSASATTVDLAFNASDTDIYNALGAVDFVDLGLQDYTVSRVGAGFVVTFNNVDTALFPDEIVPLFTVDTTGLTGSVGVRMLNVGGQTVKRVGANQYSGTGALPDADNQPNLNAAPYLQDRALSYDFDDGTARNDVYRDGVGLGALEGISGSGDSGGPALLQGRIAGVVSFGGAGFDSAETASDSSRGRAVDMRVSDAAFQQWFARITGTNPLAPQNIVLDMTKEVVGDDGVADSIIARVANGNLELLVGIAGQEKIYFRDLIDHVGTLAIRGSSDADTFLIDGSVTIAVNLDSRAGDDVFRITFSDSGARTVTINSTAAIELGGSDQVIVDGANIAVPITVLPAQTSQGDQVVVYTSITGLTVHGAEAIGGVRVQPASFDIAIHGAPPASSSVPPNALRFVNIPPGGQFSFSGPYQGTFTQPGLHPVTFQDVQVGVPNVPWTSLSGITSQIVAVSNDAGGITVFAIGGDGALYYRVQTGGIPTSFASWTSMGGFVKQFTVGQNADGTLQVFAVGGDNAAWTNVATADGSFTSAGWRSLGGYVKQLTVGRDGSDHLELFAIGGDNALWFKVQDAGAVFGDWVSLGGYVKQIVVAANADATLQVFAIGGDNALWTNKQAGSGPFGGWKSLSGFVLEIAVGVNKDGSLQVFAIGGDHALWTRKQSAGPSDVAAGFSAWASLGGYVSQANAGMVPMHNGTSVPGALAVSRHADGTLQVFVIGGDNAAWGRRQATLGGSAATGFLPWTTNGGYVKQLTTATNDNLGWVHIFAIGGDNALWTRTPLEPSPLALAGVLGARSDNALLESDLRAAIAEALRRSEAGGWPLTGALNFQIADLPGTTLGLHEGDTVFLDADAEGHGWFIDSTLDRDEEFDANGLTLAKSAAIDRVDLLSVLLHEMGHASGLAHADDGLMAASLGTGVRRVGV